jgi:hypothetical protein
MGSKPHHHIRSELARPTTTRRISGSDHVLRCRLPAEGRTAEYVFAQHGEQWRLKKYRIEIAGRSIVDVEAKSWLNRDGLVLVESFEETFTYSREGEMKTIGTNRISLAEVDFNVQDEELLIRDVENGTPIEVADVPVACEFRDGRIVMSQAAAIDTAIAEQPYAFAGRNWPYLMAGLCIVAIAVGLFLRRKQLT